MCLADIRTYWIFVSGSAILGISISLNAISTHGACTAVFVAVAAIITFFCGSIRTLGRITWLAWIGLPSILIASKIPWIAQNDLDRVSFSQFSLLLSASVYKTAPLPHRKLIQSGSQTSRSSAIHPSLRPSQLSHHLPLHSQAHRAFSLLCLKCAIPASTHDLFLSPRVLW